MSRLEDISRERGSLFSGPELMGTAFPAPRWAVPGLIVEGLTILAGAPKQGKSWLAAGLCADIAAGRPVLGGIAVDAGPTVYFALEDSPRRLQARMRQVAPEGLQHTFSAFFELPPMPLATELLEEYLTEHPDTRLVVIDVLTKIRPRTSAGTDRYEIDYLIYGQLQELAQRHGVPIVAVTHTRKMADDDVFATVLGSQGTTGAVDTILVLKRPRNESDAVLHITGRDVEEAEYALTFDHDKGRWLLAGDSLTTAAQMASMRRATEKLSDDSAAVLKFVTTATTPVTANMVATHMGWPTDKGRVYLSRLADTGRVVRVARGQYAAGSEHDTQNNSVMSVMSVTSAPGEADEHNTNNTHNTVSKGVTEPSKPDPEPEEVPFPWDLYDR